MVGRGHDEGAIGNDAVEMVAGDALGIGQDRVVGALRLQDFPVGARGGEGADGFRQRVEAVHAEQMEMFEFRRAAEQVHVRFDEAREDGGAGRVDDAGSRGLEL